MIGLSSIGSIAASVSGGGAFPPPSAPSSPIVASQGDLSVSLFCTAVFGATSYKWYRDNVLVYTGSNTFDDTGLSNEITYLYKVKSVNSNGTSVASGTLSVIAYTQAAFVNENVGNNSTAQLCNPNKPFITVGAALQALTAYVSSVTLYMQTDYADSATVNAETVLTLGLTIKSDVARVTSLTLNAGNTVVTLALDNVSISGLTYDSNTALVSTNAGTITGKNSASIGTILAIGISSAGAAADGSDGTNSTGLAGSDGVDGDPPSGGIPGESANANGAGGGGGSKGAYGRSGTLTGSINVGTLNVSGGGSSSSGGNGGNGAHAISGNGGNGGNSTATISQDGANGGNGGDAYANGGNGGNAGDGGFGGSWIKNINGDGTPMVTTFTSTGGLAIGNVGSGGLAGTATSGIGGAGGLGSTGGINGSSGSNGGSYATDGTNGSPGIDGTDGSIS